jgi:SAM-dependent methyltransferase
MKDVRVDVVRLREEVQEKYREVVEHPDATFHFHTGLRAAANVSALPNAEFREGLAEALPVPDDWADVVISNGVIDLVPNRLGAYREIARVLRPGRIRTGHG